MSIDVKALGITDAQARDLIKLAAAACAATEWEEPNPLNWALDYFEDPQALVDVGVAVWDQIDNKYRPL
ncbi:hypothetical protein AB0K21_21690 [Streptosporangium sp. NPDC049248]|uniref:hypothetical protein n=1 Tax=Streptosporangium sp. NPDC049248 TaxID=3155651 RepID=UPI00344591B8